MTRGERRTFSGKDGRNNSPEKYKCAVCSRNGEQPSVAGTDSVSCERKTKNDDRSRNCLWRSNTTKTSPCDPVILYRSVSTLAAHGQNDLRAMFFAVIRARLAKRPSDHQSRTD